jgi:hypothetical protein
MTIHSQLPTRIATSCMALLASLLVGCGIAQTEPGTDPTIGATPVANPVAAGAGVNTPVVDDARLEPPANPFAIDSPWQGSHRMAYMQASTPLSGPQSEATTVARHFEADSGVNFGASPWHVLGSKKYVDRPNARSLWGVSLKHVYKYTLDGGFFEFGASLQLHDTPLSIGWNFFGLKGDRIIVPSPLGLRTVPQSDPCFSRHPVLLELRDGSTVRSPITCVKKFELAPDTIEQACGFTRVALGTTPTITGLLYSGDIAVLIVESRGLNSKRTYLGIVDNSLNKLKACTFVDDGTSTNQFPVERLSETKSAAYIATNGGLVKMTYEAASNSLTRVWKQDYAFRNGRTGTTPTLLGLLDDADKIVVAVDSKCATVNVFSGAIVCDATPIPSRLVVFSREDRPAALRVTDLPDTIRTTENSPAARGYDLVVCNYSGYTPNGKKDGVAEHSAGLAKLRWNTTKRQFDLGWVRSDVQCSGVATISSGSNLVYFSGSEARDGTTYQYGLRFNDSADGPAGATVLRVAVGRSFESRRGANDEFFDQGNNIVVNDDNSIVWPSTNGLVRVR